MATKKTVKPGSRSQAVSPRTKSAAGRRPQLMRPKLGQTFLADEDAAGRIVEALGELSSATVVEIGPGQGALTDLLAPRARRLIAIELDRVLAAQLRMRYARYKNVEIIEADILAVDLDNLILRTNAPLLAIAPQHSGESAKASVVGNLPYYITSDILLRLFRSHTLLDRVVLMVQREVGERIAASPGTREYGLLSATAQLYARVEKLFTLPPEAFSPPPRVHSMVLRLTMAPRIETLQVNEELFIAFLKASFAQKRKTLLNNLKLRFDAPAVAAALKRAGVRPDARAEAIALDKMAAVFRNLSA
jgi:16S rRNA (adenine1518-N6/adenine1519-N6)-dimethyltransferase